MADRAVDIFTAEIDRPRGGENRHLDPRMPGLKFRHPRNQPVRGEGCDCREPDLSAVALERLYCVFDALERVAHVGEQPLAVFGEFESAPGLAHQCDPKALLQLGNPVRQRRPRHPQSIGGLLQAAEACEQ